MKSKLFLYKRYARPRELDSPNFLKLTLSFVLMWTFFQANSQQPLRETMLENNYVIREEMISMRDGIKLYTIIIIPMNTGKDMPILLERTPYDASGALGSNTTKIELLLGNKFVLEECIYVFQDIRGRYRSEGENLLYRVPRGEFNATDTDESTDAWDTIDWLIKNLSSNGRVCVWGTSFPGWLTLAALRDPHPALAAAVPFNPVVNVWKADDWFHWGAFRMTYSFDFIYEMQTRQNESVKFPRDTRDMYTWTLELGAAATGLSPLLDDRHEMWSTLMKFPSYGPYWKDVAAENWFDEISRIVPTLHVHGFWDQEDIYGSPAIYGILEKYDVSNDLNFFVAGPWYHGQHWADGSRLGDIEFYSNTSKYFLEEVLKPFLRHFLMDPNEKMLPPVTVFETGTNHWKEYDKWPPDGEKVRLYLQPEGRLRFTAPENETGSTEFVSDPAKPVPYAPRPNWSIDYDNPTSITKWRKWLVEDQRFVDGRPDVMTWITEPLTKSITITGPVTAHLIAETTGTDADWIVKLIDVYPDNYLDSDMSGYQLMVSGDIFRGRYRESYEIPQPIEPNEPLSYIIPLPHLNHTFNRGHRLMVQIQSTWFPLYDRNPQTYVESIMMAPPDSYQKQHHRVHHNTTKPTYLEFSVAED